MIEQISPNSSRIPGIEMSYLEPQKRFVPAHNAFVLGSIGVDAVPDPIAGKEPDWHQVHQLVQLELSKLGDEVSRVLPEVRSITGHHSGRVYALSTYRIFGFDLANDDDPVTAEMQFSLKEGGVSIHGDICGDSSGSIHFEATGVDGIPVAYDEVPREAHRIAECLASQAPLVIEILARSRGGLVCH